MFLLEMLGSKHFECFHLPYLVQGLSTFSLQALRLQYNNVDGDESHTCDHYFRSIDPGLVGAQSNHDPCNPTPTICGFTVRWYTAMLWTRRRLDFNLPSLHHSIAISNLLRWRRNLDQRLNHVACSLPSTRLLCVVKRSLSRECSACYTNLDSWKYNSSIDQSECVTLELCSQPHASHADTTCFSASRPGCTTPYPTGTLSDHSPVLLHIDQKVICSLGSPNTRQPTHHHPLRQHGWVHGVYPASDWASSANRRGLLLLGTNNSQHHQRQGYDPVFVSTMCMLFIYPVKRYLHV